MHMDFFLTWVHPVRSKVDRAQNVNGELFQFLEIGLYGFDVV